MASDPPNAGAHSYHLAVQWAQGTYVGIDTTPPTVHVDRVTLSEAKARGLSLTDVLAIHHLPDDGLLFDESLDPRWVDETLGVDKGAAGFFCLPGATARLEVQPMGAVATRPPILVRGRADASLRSTCVRCLAEVIMTLSVPIEQMLFSTASEDPASEEDAASAEDLDEGVYSAEGIDLPNVLREAILLELAMNPTCEEEAGCDERTQKLIDDVNAKNRPAVDPRWAVLSELMKKPT